MVKAMRVVVMFPYQLKILNMSNTNLHEFDSEWNQPSNQIATLKNKTFDLEKDMIRANTSAIQAGSHITDLQTLYSRLERLSARQSEQITLLQLQALGKITPEEMHSLLKMLASQDEENHTVANETIDNLMKDL